MRIKIPESNSCFVCGRENPIGLKLTSYKEEDGTITSRFSIGKEYTGWKNIVHGGIISTILDEVMVWAPWALTGDYYFTGEMTVRFIKPLTAGKEVTATARTENSRRRVVETSAELKDDEGTVYATAKGKYISISKEQAEEFEKSLLFD